MWAKQTFCFSSPAKVSGIQPLWKWTKSPVPTTFCTPSSDVSANGNTADTKPADNTGINARDRDNQTLTAENQGNSSTDVDLTRRIRKQIVQQDGLSTNAKNVKIITVNGKVTLRGPVNTQQEKDKISMLAQTIAGSDAIDNQLEVKTTNP